MKKYVLGLISFVMILSLVGCGFHIRSATAIPERMKTLHFVSADAYGPMSKALIKQFRLNGIRYTGHKDDASIATFNLRNQQVTKTPISIYQDGKAAEYQLILTANASITIPNEGVFTISSRVFRSFFDNPATALAKNTEQEMIVKEMYQLAAHQLIQQLARVGSATQTSEP